MVRLSELSVLPLSEAERPCCHCIGRIESLTYLPRQNLGNLVTLPGGVEPSIPLLPVFISTVQFSLAVLEL